MKSPLSFVLLLVLTPALFSQDIITDSRDGQSYSTVKIENNVWLGRNLNYHVPGSYCYQNESVYCDKYGRLYEWEAALKACPKGWHLATEFEWQQLEHYLGMDERELENQLNRGVDTGTRLKPAGDTGFNEQYGGWGGSDDGKFVAIDTIGTYWTAGEVNIERAWHRDININKTTIYRSPVIKPYALSVRCVKDHQEPSLLRP